MALARIGASCARSGVVLGMGDSILLADRGEVNPALMIIRDWPAIAHNLPW